MKLAAVFAILQLLAMCSAPPYERPDAALPPVYPDAAPASSAVAAPMTLGDAGWWQLFKDPQLLELERTAVSRNQNILIAAQRVQQAQAQLTVAHAGTFPQVNAVLAAPYSKTNGSVPITSPGVTFTPYALLTLQYEADLFGKVSSATAAARAQVLEAEFARQTVMSTVVASVATLYFQLREFDEEMVIARATLRAREKSSMLVRARYQGGIGTLQDLRQAQSLVAQVAAQIPQLQSAIDQTQNGLSVLVGGYPGPVRRGLPLDDQLTLPFVPATGVPSTLIERRPDIKQAEAALIAANAQIGQARALLFPQISLGVSAGATSAQASDLPFRQLLGLPKTVTYAQGLINVMPQLVQQIFNAGALHAQVGAAQAGREAALLQYVQTIHQDVGEVSDALVVYRDARRSALADRAYAAAAVDSTRLANMRYEGGVTSYLEVLSSQTQSYEAQLALVQAQYNTRAAVVQLYKALGGGWQPEPKEIKP